MLKMAVAARVLFVLANVLCSITVVAPHTCILRRLFARRYALLVGTVVLMINLVDFLFSMSRGVLREFY